MKTHLMIVALLIVFTIQTIEGAVTGGKRTYIKKPQVNMNNSKRLFLGAKRKTTISPLTKSFKSDLLPKSTVPFNKRLATSVLYDFPKAPTEATLMMKKGQEASIGKDTRLTPEAKTKRKNYINDSLLLFKKIVFENRKHLGLKGEDSVTVLEDYENKYGKVETKLLKDISDGTYTEQFRTLQEKKLNDMDKKKHTEPNKLMKFLKNTKLTKEEVEFQNDSKNGESEIRNVEEEEYLLQLSLQKGWDELSKNLSRISSKKKVNLSESKAERINKSVIVAKEIGQNHRTKAGIVKIQRAFSLAKKEVPEEISELIGSPLGTKITENYSKTAYVEGGATLLNTKVGLSFLKGAAKGSIEKKLEAKHSRSYEGSELTENSKTTEKKGSLEIDAVKYKAPFVNLGLGASVTGSSYKKESTSALGSGDGVVTYGLLSGLLDGKNFESHIPTATSPISNFYNANRKALRGTSGKWSKGRKEFSLTKNKITRESLESGVNDEEIKDHLKKLFPDSNYSTLFGDIPYKRIVTRKKVYDNLIRSKSILNAFDSADAKVWTSNNKKEGNIVTSKGKIDAKLGYKGLGGGVGVNISNKTETSKSYRDTRRLASPHNMMDEKGQQESKVIALRNHKTIFEGLDTVENRILISLKENSISSQPSGSNDSALSTLNHKILTNEYEAFKKQSNTILKFLTQDNKMLRVENQSEVAKAFDYFKNEYKFNFDKRWIANMVKKGSRYNDEIPAHILREGIVKIYNIFSTLAGEEALLNGKKDFKDFLESNPISLPIERVVEYSKFQKILYAKKKDLSEDKILSSTQESHPKAEFFKQKQTNTMSEEIQFSLGSNASEINSILPNYIPDVIAGTSGKGTYNRDRIKAVSFPNLHTTSPALTNVQVISTSVDTLTKRPKNLTSMIRRTLRSADETQSKKFVSTNVIYKTPKQLVESGVADASVLFEATKNKIKNGKKTNKLGREYLAQELEASTSLGKSSLKVGINAGSLVPVSNSLVLGVGAKQTRGRNSIDEISRHSLGNDIGFLGIIGNKLLLAPPKDAPTSQEHIYDENKWKSREDHTKSLGSSWMNVATNNPKYKELIFGAKSFDHASAILSKVRNEQAINLEAKTTRLKNKRKDTVDINLDSLIEAKKFNVENEIKAYKNSKGENLVLDGEKGPKAIKGENYFTHIQNLYPNANLKDAVNSWKKKYNREALDTLKINNMLSTLAKDVVTSGAKDKETIQQYLKRSSADVRFNFYKNTELGKEMFEQYIESMIYIVAVNNYITQNIAYIFTNNNIPTYRRDDPELKEEARKAFGLQ